MKKFVALAGAFALAACGGDADVEAPEEAAEATAEAVVESPLVGAYGGTTDDGEAWTSTINADGTYEDTVAGEVSETGSWTHEGDQVCFNPTVMEGEVADQTCLTLINVNEDGSLVMTDQDGNEMTVPRLVG
ncbi:hypothetical protein [Alteraurantiacibacter aquimixticola]|uniref:Lipocalin-like domain-containing protein n=1 Tax=Alteraurantiacibacter aquimixticola TaxID=2489173 RepID=A0A4T3EZ25_9SPHN|nr:hypothetical protein [Alteraurantiacibacter aquimixticola]TIX49979.1 hypothetical protein E5222_06655 [Alteraurantiacibacter aquimixticola]